MLAPAPHINSSNYFKEFPFAVTITPYQGSFTANQFTEIEEWLSEHIGTTHWRYWGAGEFLFENETNAIEFKLRWVNGI